MFTSINYECIEVDVRKIRDGPLYLSHDLPLSKEDLVKLGDVFHRIRSLKISTMVNCDLKEESLERFVFDLAEKYQISDQIILSGTVSLDNLTTKEIENNLFYNIEQFYPNIYENQGVSNFSINKLILYCQEKSIKVLNVPYQVCSPNFIQELLKEGILLSVWTVNDSEKIKAFF